LWFVDRGQRDCNDRQRRASISGASRSGMMTVTPGRHGEGAGVTRAEVIEARRSATTIATYNGVRRSRCRQLVPHMVD
jgi:hypothetical protein